LKTIRAATKKIGLQKESGEPPGLLPKGTLQNLPAGAEFTLAPVVLPDLRSA